MKQIAVYATLLLAGGGALQSAQGAVIDLPGSGWSVSWSDIASPVIKAVDNGSQKDQARVDLTLIFNDQSFSPAGFINPPVITFLQDSTPAASEVLVQATIVNDSSHDFSGMVWKLMGGAQTQFNAAAMNLGNPGGADLSGFSATFSPNQRQMYFSGAIVSSGNSLVLPRDEGIAIGTEGSDGLNAFTLKVQPSHVPEPQALGVVVLGGMVLLGRFRPAAPDRA
jgi:hypothetical protein